MVKRGQFIKLSFQPENQGLCSVYIRQQLPAYVRIDSVPSNAYSPVEVFDLLRKGDSAVIIQLADSIQKKSQQPLPPFIHKKDKIILTLRVVDVFDNEDCCSKRQGVACWVNSMQRQIKAMENYLQQHNIQATKTGDGVFVEIKNPGKVRPSIPANRYQSFTPEKYSLKEKYLKQMIRKMVSQSNL